MPTLLYLGCAVWFAVHPFSYAFVCLATLIVSARAVAGPEHAAAVAYVAVIWSWLHKCYLVAEGPAHLTWGDIMGLLWVPALVMAFVQLSGLMVSLTHA